MSITIHGGSIGRWFEELCRIQYWELGDCVVSSFGRLASGVLPKRGGVYAFWWTGDMALLSSSTRNRDLSLVGPGGRRVKLHVDDEWLGLSTKLPVPLYIGKSADSLSKRVGQHLRLSEVRMLPIGARAEKAPRPTTSCQLRAGVEHMFPNEKDSRSLILENLGFSYVELHGDDHAANRFYLEDLAIGMMRPPINVDIER